ncbi:raffinose/stachyose/melibiose transport system permease protein [Paenibacillus sophorae]|uniref:Raffinose/stachyose/melibiose transport system permease protein n=1 Tax=Paenibacillus sophorae TaxID=1333845 RepID=A0A1H8VHA8_9BACL|nr:sugar ABC transporter permease [Paenibacillus sophorae]QWU15424.1 sugar ABC transporter permease [Paenibacillus sophorae]SEP14769.1 raffinose/stachyose/melibiose transport system permease protein [Paenibacillus sophorae]
MIWLSKRRYILFMLIPTLIVYLGYIIMPVLISFYYSLTEYTGIGAARFIGLDNFSRLWHDSLFWISLKNTLIVLAVALLLLLPGAFLLALLLNVKVRGGNAVKALNFAPSIVAPILVGLIWVFILDPQMGMINVILTKLGLGQLAQPWIGGKTLTPYSIGIVFTWQMIGFLATIFLAGLKMIPRDVYESSSMDGANKVQQMFRITIPMMNETVKINVILIITGVFKIFETVLLLTNGGPNHLSEVMVTYMYNVTFTSGEYGYGMAIATVTFLLTLIFSLVYMSLSRKSIEE